MNYTNRDLGINRVRIRDGVPDVAGKTRIDIIQDDNTQAHTVAAMIFPGPDPIDAEITVCVIH